MNRICSEKERALLTFSKGLVHALNNLTSGVTAYATFLVEDLPEASPERDFAEKIMQGVAGFEGLSRSLELYGLQPPDNPTVFALESVIQPFRDHLTDRYGHELDVDFSGHFPNKKIALAQQAMNHLLCALIDNALKAQDVAGLSKAVKLIVDFDDNCLIVQVLDSGCGISTEHLAYIYDPFFSAWPEKGTMGLGLSAVKGLVRSVHGSIEVMPANPGTCMRVVLPLV